MQYYTVDFNGVKSIWDVHAALKNGLHFNDSYGMNADALWDCLTSDIDDPCVIYLKGLYQVPKVLHNEINIISNIFNRTEFWYDNIDSQVNFVVID